MKQRMLIVLLLMLIVGSAFWFLNRPAGVEEPGEVRPLPEVALTNLIRQDGVLYESNQTNLFTGYILEHYSSGVMKSRSLVSNGVLNGISEGWHTNGQLSVREHFKDGVSHGQRTKWYPGGARLSEASIANGELHGSFRRWHENGALSEEMEMREGKPVGVARSYYPSGKLKAEVRKVPKLAY